MHLCGKYAGTTLENIMKESVTMPVCGRTTGQ